MVKTSEFEDKNKIKLQPSREEKLEKRIQEKIIKKQEQKVENPENKDNEQN